MSDRIRSVVVAVAAVAQVVSAPVTMRWLGPSSDQGAISDANLSPVTPAGYAFAIWGLIYAASLAYAVYQLLPSQIDRQVHRRSGWWLAAAFAGSAVWVPIFGTRTIWLSQVVILALVACLVVAALRLTRLGTPQTVVERLLLRLPVTIYLGWATLASAAGFGATFRSLGMPENGPLTLAVSLGLIAAATAVSVLIVTQVSAVAGYAFTACWALVAVAVGTYAQPVRIAAVLAVVVLAAVLVVRTRRSPHAGAVLLG